MHTRLLFVPLLLLAVVVSAQTDSLKGTIKFGAYLEAYYLFDVANPDDHRRPDFIYSFDRHNEINLNIGVLQGSYRSSRIRANLGLMAGTYAQANLAAEPDLLQHVFEANVGVRLSKSKQLWLDVGILNSHIGFESALGADCWTMTRSLAAENSPYYSAGAQLSYRSDNEQWYLAALLLNGWQRIYRVHGNQTPAVGHQITWTPNDRLTFNSSSFIGSDMPDTARLMRYFHNFYSQLDLTEQWGLILGFDVGAQQAAPSSGDLHWWYTPVLLSRWALSERLALAARAEYYVDPDQVIVFTGTPNGFQTLGVSLNLDLRFLERVLWRVEGRWFRSLGDAIFEDAQQGAVVDNWAVGTSLSVRF